MSLTTQISFAVAFLSVCFLALFGVGWWLEGQRQRLIDKANRQADALRIVTADWRTTNELCVAYVRYLHDTGQLDKFRTWFQSCDSAELLRDIRSAKHSRNLRHDADTLLPPRPEPLLTDGPIIDGDPVEEIVLVNKIGEAMVATKI